ncbi:GntR family transcriptional regulator [Nonomuraea soli]|uniref:GntR family transcriptional regulator n=1 Tax=Nonomuraea soli TaxID=1032476 RepID=A0A7W0CS23_9ACTN|nr:GntR family transcriptional regulator [Nonomuraea soli]MBA2896163.1 GntR family transcriptional regulator [Nonomuraea soli]
MPRFKHEVDASATVPDELIGDRPKGDQLREILEALVAALGPGTLLPSERVLAERYGVARMTVRQEIHRLVADGLVVQRRGLGTFVAEPRQVEADLLTSFSEDMRARGMRPGARVLECSTESASPLLAARLGVAAGSPVLRLVRLRTADDLPMAVERTTLPMERYPGIDALDWTDRSLYEELGARWGMRPSSTQVRISAVLPSPEEAGLLGVRGAQPCFQIEGPTRDAAGVIMESSRSLYRGDRYDVTADVWR